MVLHRLEPRDADQGERRAGRNAGHRPEPLGIDAVADQLQTVGGDDALPPGELEIGAVLAEQHVGEAPAELLGQRVEISQRRIPAVIHVVAVDGVHDDRNSGQLGGDAAENAGHRAVGVDQIDPFAAQVGRQNSQCCRRQTVEPTRLPYRARSRGLKL